MDNNFGRIPIRIAALILILLFLFLEKSASASIPIDSCSTISLPGYYTLTADIINSSNDICILIKSSDVIIDGQGHRIDGKRGDYDFYDSPHPGSTSNDVPILNIGVMIGSNFSEYIYHNITIKNLVVTDWIWGIDAGKGNVINNTLVSNMAGIKVEGNGNIINNNISGNYIGIDASYGNNIIENNTVTMNSIGISLYSNNNTLSNNHIYSNTNGLVLLSSNSTFTNNSMTNNSKNFDLVGFRDLHFYNNIDKSNTVDGKSILYIINSENSIYGNSTNIGAFYCILCNNVTIKELTIRHNMGIFFWKTNNSRIENLDIESSDIGIMIMYSDNNYLSNNTLNSNGLGLHIGHSRNNTLIDNIVISNKEGIAIKDISNFNNLINNNISLNHFGLTMMDTGGNEIFNNIFYNEFNVLFSGKIQHNIWNTSKKSGINIIGGPYFGGNFRASPIGTGFGQKCSDDDHDGICDSSFTFETPLEIGDIDYLPLTYKSAFIEKEIVSTATQVIPIEATNITAVGATEKAVGIKQVLAIAIVLTAYIIVRKKKKN